MYSTETAGRRPLGNGAASRASAALADRLRGNPPIYAQLVAEWQARGRDVPGRHDAPRPGAGPAAATAWGNGLSAPLPPADSADPASDEADWLISFPLLPYPALHSAGDVQEQEHAVK